MPVLACLGLAGTALGLWLPLFPASNALPWLLLLGGSMAWWFGGWRGLVFIISLCRAGFDSNIYLAETLADALTGQDIVITGTVHDFPRIFDDVQAFPLVIDPDHFSGRPLRHVQLTWYQTTHQVRAGECWTLKVRLKPPHGYRNPAGFDRAALFFRRGVGAVGYVRDSALNRRCAPARSMSLSWRLRNGLAERLERHLQQESMLPVVLGISIGLRSRLTREQWDLLRVTGTSHLMAISGLHIGMVAAAAWLLISVTSRGLSRLGHSIPFRWLAACTAAFGAAAYAGASGFALPTVRALLMLLVALLLTLARRSWGPATAIACAVLTVLLYDGRTILSPGFWLSFGAVVLLTTCVMRVDSAVQQSESAHARLAAIWPAMKLSLRRAAQAQWAVSLGLAVPVLLSFEQVSLLAPLANLLAIPIFSLLILPLVLGACALIWWWPEASSSMLQLGCRFLEMLFLMLEWLAASLPGVWFPGVFTLWTGSLAIIGLAMLLLPMPLRCFVPGAMLLSGALLWQQHAPVGGFRLHVLDVGQGLAVIVQAGDRALLYDTGPEWRAGNAGKQIILPVLRKLGISRLDTLVVSHSDKDHSGGVQAVLDGLDVDSVVASDADQFREQSIQPCRTGVGWRWEQTRFTILHPKNRHGWTDNNASCVLLVEHAGVAILLPGDIETSAERVLLSRHQSLRVDLVIAPHHGSKTSSAAELVSATQANYVVYATGYANRWGFPHPDVVKRWTEQGACSLNTALTGALEFVIGSNGKLVLAHAGRSRWTQPWAIRRKPSCSSDFTPL